MRAKRSMLPLAISVAVGLLAPLLVTGGPAASAAAGSVRPGRAQIEFLHQTRPVSVVGARGAAASQAAATSSPDLRRLESDILRMRYAREAEAFAHEGEGGGQDLPAASSVPVGHGAGLRESFDALNHFDNRYSDNGNQFSGEPPDQALCVSDRYVLENVNSVLQVYTPDGKALIPGQPGVPFGGPVGISVNQFFGLPTSFDRTNVRFGPFVSDPECLYDSTTNRWFVTTLTLDLDRRTAAFTGPSNVLIAASVTGDPLGRWNVWSIDTTNNGTNGTPNHRCSSHFCFGDYPQLGMDRNGMYITTNEFDNIGNQEFHGAQLYALSKADLAAGAHQVSSQYFQNVPSATVGDVGYTLEPANGLPEDWDTRARGTMYFGESLTPFTDPDLAHRVVLYALSNTQSLAQDHPNLKLRERSVGSEPYSAPLYARQKDGPMPLTHCVNLGTDCIGTDYPHARTPLPLDGATAGKFYGAWIHNGTVYLTTSTGLQGSGAAEYDTSDGSWQPVDQRIGVAYFALGTTTSSSSYQVSLEHQGYVAVANANLTFPSVAIAPNGDGVIGATLAGPSYYPSAAYATFEAGRAPTSVQIGGEGVGPYDGDSATGDGGFRPRWGDYGYALAVPNGSLWVAAEYVNQRCRFGEFLQDDSTCGNTRTFYANWATRIMRIRA
ncbi:MAG: hypothetical protein ACJ76P_12710 [Actinomycetota bacterium]